MLDMYDFDDGSIVWPDNDPALGLLVRVSDTGERSRPDFSISGFPSEQAARDFILWADFEEHSFRVEAPFPFKDALAWHYSTNPK